MEDNKIAHRDIKPDNILVKNPASNPIYKLCDFNLSSFIQEKDKENSIRGTPVYFSP